MLEVQVTTALSRPRYFVVDTTTRSVAGSVFGHISETEANVELATMVLNSAQEKVNAAEKGTDEYVDARMELASAREAYDAAYAAKVGTYGNTITRK